MMSAPIEIANPLLAHVWGVSQSADRVWAHVAGMAPSRVGRQLFVALQLQAFVDESESPHGGAFVLGGYVASVQSWARFAAEWEQMLPFGTRDSEGTMHFKMADMAVNHDRMSRVPGFYRIIENNVLFALSIIIDKTVLEHAKRRIWIPNKKINWGILSNPYMLGFVAMLDLIFTHRKSLEPLIPPDFDIQFYFDRRSEKSAILSGWDRHVSNRPEGYGDYYGEAPIFENDKKFLALQAADFWVWWIREWYEFGQLNERMRDGDFGHFKVHRIIPKLLILLNEDRLMTLIKQPPAYHRHSAGY